MQVLPQAAVDSQLCDFSDRRVGRGCLSHRQGKRDERARKEPWYHPRMDRNFKPPFSMTEPYRRIGRDVNSFSA